jgi:hypothetical protein
MNLDLCQIIAYAVLGGIGIYTIVWIELDQRKVDECKRKSAEMTDAARNSMPVAEGK